MNSKKIILVVPDGTGIKNYLFSQIIPNLLEQRAEILICHSLSDNALDEVEKIHNCKLDKKPLPIYKETLYQKFLREGICYARLLFNCKLEENPTILKNWRRKKVKGLKRVYFKLVEYFGKSISKDYQKIIKYETKYQNALLSSLSNEIMFLKAYQPDVIFCTHQRAVNAIPIFKAAQVLGIKTIGAIYSWDNLVKARLAIRTDSYIVWSDYMRKELLRYYPEISKTSIQVTGTPQFQLYNKAQLLSKSDFFAKYKLNDNKFTVCFSGDDVLTSPYDPQYLEDFIKAVLNSEFKDKVQIIFRRCPADTTGRYDAIVNKHIGLVYPLEPNWSNKKENWTQLFPHFEDISLLANICKHSDLVINIGSTMAHDFSLFNNPAAYINYDTVNDKNWSVKIIYGYQHFRSMPHKNVVHWINSKEDYIKVIKSVTKDNSKTAREWLGIINDPRINSEQSITELLIK